MKLKRSCAGIIWGLLLAFWAGFSAPCADAQASIGTIQVRGLTGAAGYSAGENAAIPLRAGTVIPVGSVVKTSLGAAVDLAFSHNAGVVRLLQDSMLSLDKFTVASPTGAGVEIQLYLIQGTIVGFDKKLSGSSKYQIKVSNGIADVAGSKY